MDAVDLVWTIVHYVGRSGRTCGRIPMHELCKRRLQPQRIFRTCKKALVHSRDACTQRRRIQLTECVHRSTSLFGD